MTTREIRTIGVFGAGLMGAGIAQTFLQYRYPVVLQDLSLEILGVSRGRIEKGLNKAEERGLLGTGAAAAAIDLLRLSTDISETAGTADFLIEAVPEIPEVKWELYQKLAPLTRAGVVLASNTSTLGITELARASGDATRFIGMHFFNPVPQMKLVEIIPGAETSDETMTVTEALARAIGKDPVLLARDEPGFVVSRLVLALFLEASAILESGVAPPDAIDKCLKLGLGHRTGPFETCDLVGLDARLNNLNAMYRSTGDARWQPPELLKNLVGASYLGNKPGSKGGYYTWYDIKSA